MKVTGDRPAARRRRQAARDHRQLRLAGDRDDAEHVHDHAAEKKAAHKSAAKPKKKVIKLPATSATVQPGQAVPVDVKLPKTSPRSTAAPRSPRKSS